MKIAKKGTKQRTDIGTLLASMTKKTEVLKCFQLTLARKVNKVKKEIVQRTK